MERPRHDCVKDNSGSVNQCVPELTLPHLRPRPAAAPNDDRCSTSEAVPAGRAVGADMPRDRPDVYQPHRCGPRRFPYTVNTAILATGRQSLIDNPSRFDGVRILGVDEHAWWHTVRQQVRHRHPYTKAC